MRPAAGLKPAVCQRILWIAGSSWAMGSNKCFVASVAATTLVMVNYGLSQRCSRVLTLIRGRGSISLLGLPVSR